MFFASYIFCPTDLTTQFLRCGIDYQRVTIITNLWEVNNSI